MKEGVGQGGQELSDEAHHPDEIREHPIGGAGRQFGQRAPLYGGDQRRRVKGIQVHEVHDPPERLRTVEEPEGDAARLRLFLLQEEQQGAGAVQVGHAGQIGCNLYRKGAPPERIQLGVQALHCLQVDPSRKGKRRPAVLFLDCQVIISFRRFQYCLRYFRMYCSTRSAGRKIPKWPSQRMSARRSRSRCIEAFQCSMLEPKLDMKGP